MTGWGVHQRQDSGTDPGGRLDMANKSTDTPGVVGRERKGCRRKKKAFLQEQEKDVKNEKRGKNNTFLLLSQCHEQRFRSSLCLQTVFVLHTYTSTMLDG